MNRDRFFYSNWVLLLSALVWFACAVIAIASGNALHASIAVAAMVGASVLAWHVWHQQLVNLEDCHAVPPVIPIYAAPVQRDEDGYWTHPNMPQFEESEAAKGRAWLAATGLETHVAYLEDEAIDHPACARYWGDEGSADVSDWEPPRPSGNGWFVLSIHDTEDWGPICAWARHKDAGRSAQLSAQGKEKSDA
ncbi:hypothetical protein [Achromobacter animicus]|uniref:hypothetical protein n=1 Tax=Achromobacter animicus TaxID=1389935 RepID=UPI0028A81967|nr:hypothetical protein [Achromobacter animicus]